MSGFAIDFSFIARLEGACVTQGYVPDVIHSRSGVTLATGFDLGQRQASDLAALGLSCELQQLLTPYVGVKGAAAVEVLRKQPLQISAVQAQQLDQAFKQPFIATLARDYLAASGVDFTALPGAMQTVIASVAFQYGNLARRTPHFWQQVVHGDWPGAWATLNRFGDRYPSRRQREAALLKAALA
ncbi:MULTISPECIES: pesticin C-terminus-like muramidase [unclassified Pseudomonas]|uniref:pesticin C-terminus-like muramidase n=1 Tax=unclassified Pseudomonas TaxID=196821 RepID=UPI0014738587|nr:MULTISPECIES: pesticin C-terminus-like muramidase [unclassified Pseudomonas]NMY38719.1 peptidase [Pseudomonas sp. WS 5078]NMY61702.1 peptidase [Pseudomonas sp. WS 5354]